MESRLPVGSSANTTVGFEISARAIATRCCWPPESSDGRWLFRWVSPTRSMIESAQSRSTLRAGDLQRQQDVLLGGERGQQIEELEDEADVLAPQERQLLVVQVVTSCPAIDTEPDVGRSRPAEDVHQR